MTSTIQSHPVDPTPLVAGQGYVFDGTRLVPTTIGGGGVQSTVVTLANYLASFPGGDIPFDSEIVDQLGAWDVSTPTLFTIPSSGLYKLTATWSTTSSVTTNVHRLRFNTPEFRGGLVFQASIPGTTGTEQNDGNSYVWHESFLANDTFTVSIFVNGFGNDLTFGSLRFCLEKLS